MRGNTNRILATLLAASAVGLMTTTAQAAPIGTPTAGTSVLDPTSGDEATNFTLTPPAGAACPGDSTVGGGGWRWQTFMVASSVDPVTLTYGLTGPAQQAAAYTSPLFDASTSSVVNKTTGVTSGLITPIPTFSFVSNALPVPNGSYNLGFACTTAGVTGTFPITYPVAALRNKAAVWSTPVTVTASTASTFNYSFGAAPAAPVLASPLTPGDGTLAGTFAEAAAAPSITGFTVTAVPTSGPTVNLPLAAGATSFTLNGLVNGTSYSVSLVATNTLGSSPGSNAVSGTPAVPPPVVNPPVEIALPPARLADTRVDGVTVDGLFARQGIRPGGSTLQLTVAGRGGVDPAAVAVALNVTVAEPTGSGFVTVFPCGATQPTASNLNYTPGVVVPNAVIAKVGSNGQVCVFVSAPTELIVDVGGYFPVTTSLQSINPARVLETRVGPGLTTTDGLQQGEGLRTPGSVTAVQIGGRATVPVNATAVVLNVTVTNTQAAGFVTVYPCGTPIPTASNLNYVTGSTVANLVVAKIGASGTVCIFTNSAIDLVADINGYFPAGTSYQPLDPARLLETRAGLSTIDSQFNGIGLRPLNTITALTVGGRGGVPAGAATVVLNVTVTEPTSPGFVTVYPCGITPPNASNLNYGIGTTVANAVIVKVGSGGQVCLLNSGPTELVVDVNGYMPT